MAWVGNESVTGWGSTKVPKFGPTLTLLSPIFLYFLKNDMFRQPQHNTV